MVKKSKPKLKTSVGPGQYELTKPHPSAMPWSEYAERAKRELAELLADPKAIRNERLFQRFLEQNPSLLPLTRGPIHGGAGIFPSAAVAEPRLHGFGGKIPDFLWIAFATVTVYVVMLEIEAPVKKWFNGKGRPTAELTQARTQLAEWRAWFGDPTNQNVFIRDYRIGELAARRRLRLITVLIYGRQQETSLSASLSRLRAELEDKDEFHMTFDSIRPDPSYANIMTTRLAADGYHAKYIPPCLALGPSSAGAFARIDGKEEAVHSHPWMRKGRASFLRKRLPFWDAYAKKDKGTGVVTEYEE